jgi:hypothetical protein
VERFRAWRANARPRTTRISSSNGTVSYVQAVEGRSSASPPSRAYSRRRVSAVHPPRSNPRLSWTQRIRMSAPGAGECADSPPPQDSRCATTAFRACLNIARGIVLVVVPRPQFPGGIRARGRGRSASGLFRQAFAILAAGVRTRACADLRWTKPVEPPLFVSRATRQSCPQGHRLTRCGCSPSPCSLPVASLNHG